jgi:hypothetical protein
MRRHHESKNECWYRGTIRDVFGHRFVLATDDGPILADVGPRPPEKIKLKVGAKVNITGRQTPSEIKVRLFQSGRRKMIALHRPEKDHPSNEDLDLEAAANVALEAGYVIQGEPIRKSKHVELEAIRGSRRYELHIMPNGDIRKEKQLKE